METHPALRSMCPEFFGEGAGNSGVAGSSNLCQGQQPYAECQFRLQCSLTFSNQVGTQQPHWFPPLLFYAALLCWLKPDFFLGAQGEGHTSFKHRSDPPIE